MVTNPLLSKIRKIVLITFKKKKPLKYVFLHWIFNNTCINPHHKNEFPIDLHISRCSLRLFLNRGWIKSKLKFSCPRNRNKHLVKS